MVILDCARKIKNKVFNPYSGEKLYVRLERLFQENEEISQLFPYEKLAGHYVYEPPRQTREHPDVFINQVRYYRLYKYFQDYYPNIFSDQTSVVDVGDTSGTLFQAMKRSGLSVNINTEVVEFIKQGGIQAELGDVENLPLENKSFDYAFCFQCLEHVNNPIKGLSELSRITRKLLFASIPYVKRTRIYDETYWQNLKRQSFEEGGWNEDEVRNVDSHKFEFSTDDFKKIISHAQLEYVDSFPINYFSPLGAVRKNEGSYFNFFILKPKD